MLDKFAIASALREIGILLELKGENPYKARAYENGAAAVEGIAEDLGQVVDEKRLTKYKGIGGSFSSQDWRALQHRSLVFVRRVTN